MNFKKIKIGVEAREKVLKGVDLVADAVKLTLGPHGLNCMMEKRNRITNDGVSVSAEVCSGIKDELERRGAVVLHESSKKTNDMVGDGTTTAIVLAQAIIKECMKFLGKGKLAIDQKTPSEIIKQLKKESLEVIEKLNKLATPIKTKEALIKSALVSVDNEEMANLIGEAQWKLSKEGELIAEETAERECSVEYVKGVRIDNGFGTSLAINNVEKQTLELSDVKVILTDYTFPEDKGISPIANILNQIIKSGERNIVVIARAFSDTAIKDCMENAKKGYNIFPVNAPYTDQKEIMKDLEAVLGGRFINHEESNLEDMTMDDVGFAERIVAGRYSAVITGRKSKYQDAIVKDRIEEIEKTMSKDNSDFMKRNMRQRIAQLKNGFGLIKVGAKSEIERKYLKDKVDDAVNAVRVAYQEGVVPGAGLAFKQISDELPEDYILKRPLKAINEQIMFTSPADFVVEDWVKDPVKVLRVALENACSVAGTFASVGSVIASFNPHQCQCAGSLSEEEEVIN